MFATRICNFIRELHTVKDRNSTKSLSSYRKLREPRSSLRETSFYAEAEKEMKMNNVIDWKYDVTLLKNTD